MYKISINRNNATLNKLTHYATSWRLYDDPNGKNLIFEKLVDTKMLTTLYVDMELDDSKTYYVQTKLYFKDNNGNIKETPWSKLIPITNSEINNATTDELIKPPVISLDRNPNYVPTGNFNIMTSTYTDIRPDRAHDSTDWLIVDANGNTVWSSLNDKEHLTSIIVPKSTLEPEQTYFIKVRHKNNYNEYSPYGTMQIRTVNEENPPVEYRTDMYEELTKIVATTIYMTVAKK